MICQGSWLKARKLAYIMLSALRSVDGITINLRALVSRLIMVAAI
jgi:hypothetical protein